MSYSLTELEQHIAQYNVGSGVSTLTTTGSTAADAGAGDQRDENIRQINNIRLDLNDLAMKFSDLIAVLREKNLLPE